MTTPTQSPLLEGVSPFPWVYYGEVSGYDCDFIRINDAEGKPAVEVPTSFMFSDNIGLILNAPELAQSNWELLDVAIDVLNLECVFTEHKELWDALKQAIARAEALQRVRKS